MKQIILLLFLISSVAQAQEKSISKKENIVNSIIGIWVFTEGYQKHNKAVTIEGMMDSIVFRPDKTLKYILHDSKTYLIVTGKWDISEDGRTIKFMNRSSPSKTGNEKVADLQFPFKLIGATKLRIEEILKIVPNPNLKSEQQIGKMGDIKFVSIYIKIG